MPIYPYSFQLPPLNVQEIPNDGVAGQFLGINGSGALDWLPVSAGGGDMLKSENLSGLADYPTARTNLGLGTTDSPTFKNLTISTGTITTSAPVTISQTWNALAVAFTALKVNAVSTASATGSLLLDLQVGGVSQFRVTKAGAISCLGATFGTGLGAVSYADLTVGGFWASSSGTYGIRQGEGFIAGVASFSLSSTNNVGIPDVRLYAPSANTLEFRNGTNAQTFNVYGTSSSSNTVYERMFARYDGTALAFQVGTQHVGASARPLQLLTDNTTRMTIGTTGNVGIGTTAPAAPLEIRGTAASGVRESLLKCTVSDAGNDAFHIFNGTSLDNRFSPSFSGSIFSSNGGALSFSSQTDSANDTGTGPLMIFSGRITTSQTDPNNGTLSAVTTRPLFAWWNLSTPLMQLNANGNLGIGTTAPSSNLTVAQGTAGVGTISVGAAGTTITGVGTQFLNTFAVGQTITSAGQTLTISAIASDTSMTISPAAGAAISGQAYTLVGGTRFTVAGNGKVGIGANVFLERDGDNLLALRNSTAAQTFRVYNTYTSDSSYERASFNWASNVFKISTDKLGGGSDRGMEINAGLYLNINVGGSGVMGLSSSAVVSGKNLTFLTDSTYDIGASGANRPRNVYVGGSVSCLTGVNTLATGAITFSNSLTSTFSEGAGIHVSLQRSGNGILTISNGSSAWDRLQFGGTTSGFPSIKRVGTDLQVVIASTTAAIGVAAGDADMTFIEDRYRRKGAGSPEGAVTAPIGAVYHRTDGGLMSSFYVKESGTGNTGWVGK